jgi:hypothetical protein
MKKRQQVLLGSVGILALVLALVVVLNNSASAEQPVERPFQMKSFDYVTQEGPNVGDCPVITVEIGGEGNATHMGQVSISRRHCFNPAEDPPISEGYWEVEGANGDKIWGSYSAVLVPTEFDGNVPIRGEITGPFTIDGGTGQFEGATGEGVTTGDYDLVADSGDFITEGTIIY